MSGGVFDYQNYRLNDFVDIINKEVLKPNKQESDYYDNLQDATKEQAAAIKTECRDLVQVLESTSKRLKNLDWFLSGDDGEETYLEHIAEELETNKESIS